MGYKTITVIFALIALTLASSAGATQTSCLDTAQAKVATSAMADGLGLTPAQVKAVRARLSTYGSVQGFAGFDGLGLTAAQIVELKRRLAAQIAAHTHPAGWPCAPFKNQARVMRFVKAKLIYNGFRPAMQFFVTSTRQFRFNAIQDGIQYYGVVAKTGARQIAVALDCTRSCNTGGTYTFSLTFDA